MDRVEVIPSTLHWKLTISKQSTLIVDKKTNIDNVKLYEVICDRFTTFLQEQRVTFILSIFIYNINEYNSMGFF